ncbi:hypothetical protein RIF29_41155 [Crotalaria pallida]|uniref:Transposase, Ptta/En/Spm, plant n=1 Tax=Crotalaria pallida TaxID=3830 RepID=A0AAN9E7H2_CROPI
MRTHQRQSAPAHAHQHQCSKRATPSLSLEAYSWHKLAFGYLQLKAPTIPHRQLLSLANRCGSIHRCLTLRSILFCNTWPVGPPPITTPTPHSTTPEPTQPQPIPTQVPHTQESPVINQTHASSSSHATGGNNENKIVIVPEGDGFDKHKLVISNIASCIRKKFDEAKPSWKKMSTDQRDTWFDMFQKDFTWLPQYNDMVRRNFEKRGSAKLTQLLQEARKNLDRRPSWIGDSVWARLKQHWQSSEFKKKSETNKRNRDSMAGASLHTGGSIPHREHWKRMKAELGSDPPLVDFYFCTHQKKDKTWVGHHTQDAYEKFQHKNYENDDEENEEYDYEDEDDDEDEDGDGDGDEDGDNVLGDE